MTGDAQEPKRAMSKDEIDQLFSGEGDAQEKLNADAAAGEAAGDASGEAAGDDASGEPSAAAEEGASGDPGNPPEQVPDGIPPEGFEGSTAPQMEPGPVEEPRPQPVEFGRLSPQPMEGEPANIRLLLDVKLPLTVELGRAHLPVKEILEFGSGSIVELDRAASEPVDLLVNGVLVAHGEVVVIEDRFGIRLTALISPEERIRCLGGN